MTERSAERQGVLAPRLIEALLAAYVLLAPWMWSPFAFNLQWADLVFVGLVFCCMVSFEMRYAGFVSLDCAVVLYLAGAVVAFLLASPSLGGAIEIAKMLYLGAVYFVIGAIVEDSHARVRTAEYIGYASLAVAGVGVVCVMTYVVLQHPIPRLGVEMSVPYLGNVLRLTGGFPSAELLGNYLTMSFPVLLGLYTWARGSRWMPWGIGVLAIVLVEVMTFSHSWVGFLFSGIAFAWNDLMAYQRRWLRRALVVTLIGMFLVINLMSIFYVREVTLSKTVGPPSYANVPSQVLLGEEWPKVSLGISYNYMYYYLLKDLALGTFVEHPFVGLGLGRFGEVTEQAFLENRIKDACRGCDPHCTLLGIMAETGLVGAVALVGLWWSMVYLGKRFLHSRKGFPDEWVLKAVLAGMGGLLVNSINADIMNFRFLWIGFAFLRGYAIAVGKGNGSAITQIPSQTLAKFGKAS